MNDLFAKLKRRNVFKVGAAYAIVAWLPAPIAAVTFPALVVPDWLFRAFIILLILAFPIAS